MKFDPKTGKTTEFRKPSGRSNGLKFDAKGRLVACEGANTGGGRRISVTEKDGTVKTLADKYVDAAIEFFSAVATDEELQGLRHAAERSKEVVNVADLEPDARRLVAAFARRLQSGSQPSKEMNDWLDSKYPERKRK